LYNLGLDIPETDFYSGRVKSLNDFQGPGTGLRIKGPLYNLSCHTTILAEDIASNQDWFRNLLKYPNEPVTFYNACHSVGCQLGPTLSDIKLKVAQRHQTASQASVQSQHSFYGFADS
jgi:hypothetical protein